MLNRPGFDKRLFHLRNRNVKKTKFWEVFPFETLLLLPKWQKSSSLKNRPLGYSQSWEHENFSSYDKTKVDKMILDIKKETNFEEFTKINVNKNFETLFNDIVSTILFGDVTEELRIIPSMTDQALQAFERSGNHILSLITKGLLTDFGVLPDARKSMKIQKEIERRLRKICEERCRPDYPIKMDNILDLMIASNRTAIAEGRENDVVQIQEMVSNFEIVVFAGIDTSRNVSRACLHFINSDKKIRKKVQEEMRNLDNKKNLVMIVLNMMIVKF